MSKPYPEYYEDWVRPRLVTVKVLDYNCYEQTESSAILLKPGDKIHPATRFFNLTIFG